MKGSSSSRFSSNRTSETRLHGAAVAHPSEVDDVRRLTGIIGKEGGVPFSGRDSAFRQEFDIPAMTAIEVEVDRLGCDQAVAQRMAGLTVPR
jgi:hypothetical protein